MARWIAAARKSYAWQFALLRDGLQYLSVHQAYIDLSIKLFLANFGKIIPISILRHLYPMLRLSAGVRIPVDRHCDHTLVS
jgi:hypothetical protein